MSTVYYDRGWPHKASTQAESYWQQIAVEEERIHFLQGNGISWIAYILGDSHTFMYILVVIIEFGGL